MTQQEIIISILEDSDWHCGREFMQTYVPEYRSRINEIRKKGIMIETRKCQQHDHGGNLQEWRIMPKEAQLTLI